MSFFSHLLRFLSYSISQHKKLHAQHLVDGADMELFAFLDNLFYLYQDQTLIRTQSIISVGIVSRQPVRVPKLQSVGKNDSTFL